MYITTVKHFATISQKYKGSDPILRLGVKKVNWFSSMCNLLAVKNIVRELLKI